jgi:hypothetical protein
MRPHPPRGFRIGHGGDLACPHRDVTCCDQCASAHPEIMDVAGVHMWITDAAERAEVAAFNAHGSFPGLVLDTRPPAKLV